MRKRCVSQLLDTASVLAYGALGRRGAEGALMNNLPPLIWDWNNTCGPADHPYPRTHDGHHYLCEVTAGRMLRIDHESDCDCRVNGKSEGSAQPTPATD